jgi:anti-anti-sigma regulatory factor
MKQAKRKRAAATQVASASERAVEVRTVNTTDVQSREKSASARGLSDAPVAQRSESGVLALGANCTVRDCSALKSELLDLLAHRQPVTIDVSGVERIDTAAMQVLCAFARDRQAAGGQVRWVGQAPGFVAAVRLLGLKKVLGVSDAQLTMRPA